MESFILFYQKCRLCLENSGEHNMFAKEELPRDIYLCTGVQVHPTDNLPQKICDPCSKVISSASKLRNVATKNNIHLRMLLNDGSEDSEKSNENSNTSCNTSQTNTPNKSSNKNNSSNNITIAVRKDLFESTTTVSSSNKRPDNSDSEHEESTQPSQSSTKKSKLESAAVVEYVCNECSKSFQSWKKFYQHQRMHNRKVVCPLESCAKKFATKGDLEKHFRTHTGEKPYKCNLCNKGFAQRVTLKSHRSTVHSNT